MKRRLLVLVNDVTQTNVGRFLAPRFSREHVTVASELPHDVDRYDLAVLWNYRRILPGLEPYRNVVVCHASALPEDRGMAPIYYTIARERPSVTISVLRPVDDLDAGPIVARASFAQRPDYTATLIRSWISEISVQLLDELSRDGRIQRMRGRSQHGAANVNGVRVREQSEVRLEDSLGALMPHLRACEPEHPAFVEYHGVRYILEVRPAEPPPFPEVTIEFYD